MSKAQMEYNARIEARIAEISARIPQQTDRERIVAMIYSPQKTALNMGGSSGGKRFIGGFYR